MSILKSKPNSAGSLVVDANRKTSSASYKILCVSTKPYLLFIFTFSLLLQQQQKHLSFYSIFTFSFALDFIPFFLPKHFVATVTPSSLPLSLESLPVSWLLFLSLQTGLKLWTPFQNFLLVFFSFSQYPHKDHLCLLHHFPTLTLENYLPDLLGKCFP